MIVFEFHLVITDKDVCGCIVGQPCLDLSHLIKSNFTSFKQNIINGPCIYCMRQMFKFNITQYVHLLLQMKYN